MKRWMKKIVSVNCVFVHLGITANIDENVGNNKQIKNEMKIKKIIVVRFGGKFSTNKLLISASK